MGRLGRLGQLGRWVAAFVLLATAACQAPIEGPAALGEPGEGAIEERLFGLWHAAYAEDGERVEIALLVSPRAGTPYADIVLSYADTERAPEGKAEADWRRVGWFRAEAYAVELDGRTYYAVRRLPGATFDYTPEGAKAGFMLVRAVFDGKGELTLEGMAEARVKQYAPAYGAHLGTFPIEGGDTFRWLDASRDELRQLVRSVGPDNLFVERWGPFRKADGINLPNFRVTQPEE